MLEIFALDNLLEADEGPPEELVALARGATEARARKDFAEADRLRDEVRAAGWEIRGRAPERRPSWCPSRPR